MTSVESLLQKQFEKTNLPNTADELPEIKELPDDIEELTEENDTQLQRAIEELK